MGIAIGVLSMLLCYHRTFYTVDKIFSDPLYYMQTTTDTSIKIIAIDEKTLDALGPMNGWSRDVYARLVNILTENEEYKPAVIGFDIMFTGELDSKADSTFASAVKNAGNVVTASNVVLRDKGSIDFEGNFNMDYSNIDMIELPYSELELASKHGFANTLQDRDGYIRFEKYQFNHNGINVKSFTAQVYETYCEKKGIEKKIPKTFEDNIFYFTFSDKNSSYEVDSLIDVLEGKTDIRAFKDCVVLVGAYAPGMMDAYNVAVQKGAQMYGVEIHANILEALIEEKTAVPVSNILYSFIVSLVAVSFYYLNRKLRPVYGAVVMLGVSSLSVIVGKVLYDNGYVMDIIYIPIILLFIYIMQLVIRITLFNRMYTKALKEQMYSFADAFATAVDERTPYNGSHTKKVAEYVVAYAKYSNILYRKGITDEYFDKNRIGQLRLAATLHDIGKMIIPKAVMNKATRLDKNIEKLDDRYKLLDAYYEIDILNGRIDETEGRRIQEYLKESCQFIHEIDGAGFLPDDKLGRIEEISEKAYTTPKGEQIPFLTEYEKNCLMTQKGTLTANEREIMESHVVMTQKILSKVKFHSFHKDVASIAARHHEFLNGTGYPNKLTEQDLSIECRVLTIADIYDALTCTDRPYKKPMPRQKAFSILEAMVEEGKLDGQLVKWFEEAIEYFYKEKTNDEDK